MRKRILSLLLAALLLLGAAPTAAHAAGTVASGTCGENLTWTLDEEGTLTISGTGIHVRLGHHGGDGDRAALVCVS